MLVPNVIYLLKFSNITAFKMSKTIGFTSEGECYFHTSPAGTTAENMYDPVTDQVLLTVKAGEYFGIEEVYQINEDWFNKMLNFRFVDGNISAIAGREVTNGGQINTGSPVLTPTGVKHLVLPTSNNYVGVDGPFALTLTRPRWAPPIWETDVYSRFKPAQAL